MEEGVYFQGECDMGVAPKQDMDVADRVLSNGKAKSSMSSKVETEMSSKMDTEPISLK
jgi:hypothetical protein